jgi:hypothetical protein
MDQHRSARLRTLWIAACLGVTGTLTGCAGDDEEDVVTVSSAPAAPTTSSGTGVKTGTTSTVGTTSAAAAVATTSAAPTSTTTATTSTSTAPASTTTTASAAPAAPTATAAQAAPSSALGLGACVASGKGTDYQVGPDKPYTSLDAVPWENLKAGDTVRIFYAATPYRSKFMIGAVGTQAAPVRICGVRGPNNERPIIDGNGATTRAALLPVYGNTPETQEIHQARDIITIKAPANGAYEAYPNWIIIDGLNIRAGHPNYTFKNAAGVTKPYDAFGACIWIDRGQNVSIVDNEISDCPMAIFSKSLDEGNFTVTKNIRIAGNYLWGHGIAGDDHMHTTYTESVGLTIEYNRYGPLRSGALGNSIKDRSAGLVVRYNRIEGGAHAIDMVEAEDFPKTATALSAYRSTYVYGNQIRKNGDEGSFFHYGGDHFGAPAGANWGETLFRQGTLYFFNNTVHGTGKGARLFHISTTLETVEAWNNVFWFDSSVTELNLRQSENDSLSASYTSDGILNLGVNWIRTGWTDTTQWKTLKGQVKGTANLITGTTVPFDAATFIPLAGSVLLDAAQNAPAGAAAYGVNYQLNTGLQPVARPINNGRMDLGAVER